MGALYETARERGGKIKVRKVPSTRGKDSNSKAVSKVDGKTNKTNHKTDKQTPKSESKKDISFEGIPSHDRQSYLEFMSMVMDDNMEEK